MVIAYLVHVHRRLVSFSKAVRRLMIFVYNYVALMVFMKSLSLDPVRVFLFGAYVAVTNGHPYKSPHSALLCTYMGDLYLVRSMHHDAMIYGV